MSLSDDIELSVNSLAHHCRAKIRPGVNKDVLLSNCIVSLGDVLGNRRHNRDEILAATIAVLLGISGSAIGEEVASIFREENQT